MSYINTETSEYPIQERDIITQNPNTSFGIPFQAPSPFMWVFPTSQEYDSDNYYIREVAPQLTEKGHWEQRWELVELDQESKDRIQAEKKQQKKNTILDQILTLQQKCLRCLVEDAPDTTWLDKYKAQIQDLREQLKTL